MPRDDAAAYSEPIASWGADSEDRRASLRKSLRNGPDRKRGTPDCEHADVARLVDTDDVSVAPLAAGLGESARGAPPLLGQAKRGWCPATHAALQPLRYSHRRTTNQDPRATHRWRLIYGAVPQGWSPSNRRRQPYRLTAAAQGAAS